MATSVKLPVANPKLPGQITDDTLQTPALNMDEDVEQANPELEGAPTPRQQYDNKVKPELPDPANLEFEDEAAEGEARLANLYANEGPDDELERLAVDELGIDLSDDAAEDYEKRGVVTPGAGPGGTNEGVMDGNWLTSAAGGVKDAAGFVGNQLYNLTSEALPAVGNAVEEGARSFMGLAQDLTDTLNDWAGVEGSLKPEYRGLPKEKLDKLKNSGVDVTQDLRDLVPDLIEGPETGAGKMLQGITQFMIPFGKIQKSLGIAKAGAAVGPTVIKSLIAGGITDLAFFEGNTGNIANVLEEFVPGLGNPVTKWLSTGEEDKGLEGRIKNALAGGTTDVVAGAVMKMLRMWKGARKVVDIANTDPATGLPREVNPTLKKLLVGSDKEISDVAEATVKGPDLSARLRELTGDPAGPVLKTDVPAEAVTNAAKSGGATTQEVAKKTTKPYVNFARIQSDADIDNVVADLVTRDKDAIATAQRGVRTTKQTKAAAEKIGDKGAWEYLNSRKSSSTMLNAEETLAVRTLWADSADEVYRLAEIAENGDEAATFAFQRHLAIHEAIQRKVMGVRTEQARALQQWRIPAGSGRESTQALQDILNAPGARDFGRYKASAIMRLKRSPHVRGKDLEQAINRSVWAKTRDVIHSIYINGMLSNPTTHVVNLLGNASTVAWAIARRGVAGMVGEVLNPHSGVKAGEAAAMMHAVRTSYRDAFRFAYRAGMDQQSGFYKADVKDGLGGSHRTKLEGMRPNAISAEYWNIGNHKAAKLADGLGAVIGAPGRMLLAGDEFFKTVNYRMEVHALAFRRASQDLDRGLITEGGFADRVAKYTEEPPLDFRAQAQQFAEVQTFTNDPGKVTKAFQKLQKIPVVGPWAFPFIRTPGNIMRFATENGPFGVLYGNVRADLVAGGARRSEAIAKITLGSAIMATAYEMAQSGAITGAGPSDWRVKQAMMRAGWRPYSVRIGDTYIAYSRFDPLGFLLGGAGDLFEISMDPSDAWQEKPFEEVAFALAFKAGKAAMNRAYLQTTAQLFDAIADPEGATPTRVAGRAVGALVPFGALQGQINRAMDPEQKQITEFMDNIKGRVVGMRDMESSLDFWGNPVKYGKIEGGDTISGLYLARTLNFINPFHLSKAKNDPVEKEFWKLGYFPGHTKSISMPGETGSKTVALKRRPKIFNDLIKTQMQTPASKLYDMAKATEDNEGLYERIQSSTAAKRYFRQKHKLLQQLGDLTSHEALKRIIAGKVDDEYVGELAQEYADAHNDDKKDILQDVVGAYRKGAQYVIRSKYADELFASRDLRPGVDFEQELPAWYK
jgi:hypothetical protein